MATLLPTQNLNLHTGSASSGMANLSNSGGLQAQATDSRIPFSVNVTEGLDKEVIPLVKTIESYYIKKFQDEQDAVLAEAVNDFQSKDREDLLAYSQLKGQDAIDGWQDYLSQRETRKREYESVFNKYPDLKQSWVQKIDSIQSRNMNVALDHKVNEVNVVKGNNLQATLTNALNDYTLFFNSPQNEIYKNAVIDAFNDIQDFLGVRQLNADGTENEVYKKNRRDLFDDTAKLQVKHLISLKQYGNALTTLNVMQRDMNATTYDELLTSIRAHQADEAERQARIRAHNSQQAYYDAQKKYADLDRAESDLFIKRETNKNAFRYILQHNKRQINSGVTVDIFDTSDWKQDEFGNVMPSDIEKFLSAKDGFTKEQMELLVDAFNVGSSMAQVQLAKEQTDRQRLGDAKANILNGAWNILASKGLLANQTLEQRADPLRVFEDNSSDADVSMVYKTLLDTFGDVEQARKAIRTKVTINSLPALSESNLLIEGLKSGAISDAEFYVYLGDKDKVAQYEYERGMFTAQAAKAILDKQRDIQNKIISGEFLKHNEPFKAMLLYTAGQYGCSDPKKLSEWKAKNPVEYAKAQRVAQKSYLNYLKEQKDNTKILNVAQIAGLEDNHLFNAGYYSQMSKYTSDYQVALDSMGEMAKDLADECGDWNMIEAYKDSDVRRGIIFQNFLNLYEETGAIPTNEDVYNRLLPSGIFINSYSTLQDFYDNKTSLVKLPKDQKEAGDMLQKFNASRRIMRGY